jgi:methyl-accepting chemotaxis protein
VQAIERQTVVVEEESRTVGTAGQSLSKIREVSNRSASLVGDITEIARAQVAQAERVVSAMDVVSSISAQTQASAERTSNTVGSLLSLSSRLGESVSRFRISNGSRA